MPVYYLMTAFLFSLGGVVWSICNDHSFLGFFMTYLVSSTTGFFLAAAYALFRFRSSAEEYEGPAPLLAAE
jgi:hypothetical protein